MSENIPFKLLLLHIIICVEFRYEICSLNEMQMHIFFHFVIYLVCQGMKCNERKRKYFRENAIDGSFAAFGKWVFSYGFVTR